jgi:glycosyltransferase involved in cell wall biosynthesis
VDIGSRSHLYLVQAIDRLRETDPELGSRIELCLAGVLTDLDIATTDRPYIRRLGFVSHDESVGLLRSADALFLPMHDLADGRRARIVPGKTYEYLAAGRPILAAVPDGDARDLLLRAGNAVVRSPRDVDGLVEALRLLAAGAVPAQAKPDVIAPFHRHALTARMASILDGVVPQRTAVAA